MKAKTKLTKLWAILLSLVMLLSLLPTTAFAAGSAETTDITEINLTGDYQYGNVPAGVLPAFNPGTTTDSITINKMNSGWEYKMESGGWSGFGLETPVAYNDGKTDYGYTFCVKTNDGYQLDYSNLKVFYNEEEVTSSVKILKYAWGAYVDVDLGKANGTPVVYTITFNSNDGTSVAPQDVNAGEKLTEPTPAPTKVGFTFDGWYEDSTFSKKFDFNTPITDNMTLYANWTENKYTLTFDANGGSGTMAPIADLTGEHTLPANEFTAPSGKQFKGWSLTTDGAIVTKVDMTENRTVYAIWENIPVVTYTVSFAANGGTGTMADVTGVSGEYTLPANGFTAPTGKQFKAWSVGGVEKAAGDKITVTANTTVTAVWEDIPVVTYTVSFAANGGTGTMADVTGISGEYTLPANGFTAPAGKQFKAWSVGGVEKAAGDKITVTANTTVTAVWEAIEYNVTVTGGTASVGAGTPITKATMGTTVTLTAGAAPSGKVFDKWEVVSGGITLADANSATTTFTMPASAVSVKATYKNAPHTPTPTPTHTHNLTLVAAKAATCTEGGKEAYYKCEGCGKFYEDVLGTKEITDLASWGNIAKIAHTTKLNATSLTYNEKVRTPKVIVKDETGKTLVKNTDYTVSYAKGRKYVGKYAVKITFKGKYSGTKTLYFTIKPKATSISSLKAGSKKFTVKWKKQATQTTGYQVQYSASSEFSKAKTVTVGKNRTVSKKISKLSGKKKYYVRVRTYKTVEINGKSTRIYSGWSKAETVTTKK